jgi:hypothetical protein
MVVIIFSALSVAAIVSGALISAFSAREPTWSTAWVSAYLVLVVGIIQLGLITAWHKLGQPETAAVLVAMLAYNLGNAGVITGTLYKTRSRSYRGLVKLGGLFIAMAIALLLFAVRDSHFSWILIEFVGLLVIILISAPIGLVLSSRNHKKIRG